MTGITILLAAILPLVGTTNHQLTTYTPLTDFVGQQLYKGEAGGLYGRNSNRPPLEHFRAAGRAGKRIVPRDSGGNPSPSGRIGLVSIGMSNTTQEFSRFVQIASAAGQMSPRVTLIDGAQGGQTARAWATNQNPWDVLAQRLASSGTSNAQVQAVWIKLAQSNPSSLGAYPLHANSLRSDTAIVVRKLKQVFPNLEIAYLSSRIYAGYASTTLNPEPYAYESAFAMRQLISDQINGARNLNCDPRSGPVVAPIMLWGPYLWADGPNGRQIDSLVWLPGDFAADGTHPATSGREKVAQLLLTFFKNDPTTSSWFNP